ncbi:hypothetical protein B7463_g11398, partial [Scytalidium lignicola]
MNTPSTEAVAMLASVDVSIESAVELNKPTSRDNQEVWYDIEYGCYVLENCPLPSLETDDLALTAAPDNNASGGLSHSTTSKPDGGNTQSTSEERVADILSQPTEKEGEHDCGESVSETKKDMLLAFERQENMSSACTTNFLHPHHHSPEFAHIQVDKESDRNGHSHDRLEGLSHASPLCVQPQKEADAVPIPPTGESGR